MENEELQKQRCSVCNEKSSFFVPLKMYELDGKIYCEEHYQEKLENNSTGETEKEETEKDILEKISEQLSNQAKDIKTTKNILIFFTVMVLLGIFIEIIVSCTSH